MSSDPRAERLVILCNDAGEPTGASGLLAAHQHGGKLHRAFSVFVFRQGDQERELLIQQRSENKLLFAGHWANTCCSHPTPSDGDISQAAELRLREEFGFTVPLQDVGSFVYRATDERTGGTEYEHDTVFVGQAGSDVRLIADPNEISDHKWVTLENLQRALDRDEQTFAPWFRPALSVALRNDHR